MIMNFKNEPTTCCLTETRAKHIGGQVESHRTGKGYDHANTVQKKVGVPVCL